MPELLQMQSLQYVWIETIQGRRERTRKPEIRWFTVFARFAIQVEGQTSGSQTYEERFVAVKARSFDEAMKKLKPEFRDYAAPYLNSDGERVRWAFEEVVDVYDTGEPRLEGDHVEVFSRLKRRRMRPGLVWKPKRPSRRS